MQAAVKTFSMYFNGRITKIILKKSFKIKITQWKKQLINYVHGMMQDISYWTMGIMKFQKLNCEPIMRKNVMKKSFEPKYMFQRLVYLHSDGNERTN